MPSEKSTKNTPKKSEGISSVEKARNPYITFMQSELPKVKMNFPKLNNKQARLKATKNYHEQKVVA